MKMQKIIPIYEKKKWKKYSTYGSEEKKHLLVKCPSIIQYSKFSNPNPNISKLKYFYIGSLPLAYLCHFFPQKVLWLYFENKGKYILNFIQYVIGRFDISILKNHLVEFFY